MYLATSLKFLQLKMASGSLRQFVSLNWSERLTGTAIDDPENTLYQYLPSGVHYIFVFTNIQRHLTFRPTKRRSCIYGNRRTRCDQIQTVRRKNSLVR